VPRGEQLQHAVANLDDLREADRLEPARRAGEISLRHYRVTVRRVVIAAVKTIVIPRSGATRDLL
jgi:hypothetical protein